MIVKSTRTKPRDTQAWEIPEDKPCDVYIYIFSGAAGTSANIRGKVKKRGGAIEIWDGANHVSLSSLQPIKMWEQTLVYKSGDVQKATIAEVSVNAKEQG